MSLTSIDYNTWKKFQSAHRAEVEGYIGDYQKNKSKQEVNPVVDFLFRYYNFSANKLATWSPGINTRLEKAAAYKNDFPKEFSIEGDDLILTIDQFKNSRLKALSWTIKLLRSIDSRKPLLNCCGLHEWAMVYKSDVIRHESYPLRLSEKEINRVVEDNPITCTHFDAFRFFTPEAAPLNRNELSRDSFLENEQPGCIHTNMDTYKWAYKFYPFVSSECIIDTFKHAMYARKIDMMASPYNLESIGYEPILIETEAGRIIYKQKQAEVWKLGIDTRKHLIRELESIEAFTKKTIYEL